MCYTPSMMKLKEARDLQAGDSIYNFGKVYHTWYNHHRVFVAVKNKKARSYHPEQKVIVEERSATETPKMESQLAFEARRRAIWHQCGDSV